MTKADRVEEILEKYIHHFVAKRASIGFIVEEDKKLTKDDIAQAHKELDKVYIPSVEELEDWLKENLDSFITSFGSRGEDYNFDEKELAQAIHKRLEER